MHVTCKCQHQLRFVQTFAEVRVVAWGAREAKQQLQSTPHTP